MEYEVVVVTGVHSGEVFVRTHTREEAERFAAVCLRRYGSAAVRSIREGLRAGLAQPAAQPVPQPAATLANRRAS